MNTEELISSGIIESYVLGLASDEEYRILMPAAEKYQEVAKAIRIAELKFEAIGLQGAIPPPPATWEKIQRSIDDLSLKQVPNGKNGQSKPSSSSPGHTTIINIQNPNNQITVHKFWRPAFIAVFILSKIFLALSLFYYFKSESLVKENQELKIRAGQVEQK